MPTSSLSASETRDLPPPHTWTYGWARLRAMERREVVDRSRQALAKRWDVLRHHLALGFDHVPLRAVQCRPRFFFQPEDLPELISLVRRHCPREVEATIERARDICRHRFNLLGYANLDYGPQLDWHFDPVHGKRAAQRPWYQIPFLDFYQVGDSKIIWELNRHQHLVTLAKAFRFTGDSRFAAEVLAQIFDWLDRNPYPMGINWASSLEVGFRSLSWLWVMHLMAGSSDVPGDFRPRLLRALALHGRHIERYLSTYFSANTHLLGEGVALFFLGTMCPELPRAQQWQKHGWEIVQREADHQVLSDGLHFEQSTYYHVYALDFFLHARILAGCNDVSIPAAFDGTLQRMLEALMHISQTGIAPRFGDDDGGRLFEPRRNRHEHMLDPLATGATLFQREDFASAAGGLREETLWLLGRQAIELLEAPSPTSRSLHSLSLPAGGLYVLANFSPAPAQLVIDAGPQGYGTAGHSHADALSIQLSAGGKQLLLDPGTFEYVGRAGDRDRFRGTGAHNTLGVDGRDQAQPVAPFRWTGLPRVEVERWQMGERFDFFVGRHHGYEQLPGSVVHHRSIFAFKPGFWLVRDMVTGSGLHKLEVSWHLGVHLNSSKQEGVFAADDASTGLIILVAQEHGWSRVLEQGWWSPAYGCKEPISVLRVAANTALPAECGTLLIPRASDQAAIGDFARIQQGIRNASGYYYRCDQNEHFVCFSNGREWHAGALSSDAELLFYRVQRTNNEHELIFAQGTRVNFQGRALITCESPTAQCEILWSGNGTSIMATEPDKIVLHQPLDTLAAGLESLLCPASSGPSAIGS